MDDEIDRLSAAFADGTLGGEERQAFLRRLEEDPAAMKRFGEIIAFEMELVDAVRGDQIEIVRQQRMIVDRASGRALMVESTDRVGQPGMARAEHAAPPRRRWWPWVSLCAIGIASGVVWYAMNRKGSATFSSPPSSVSWTALTIRNPGFEQPVLTGTVRSTREMTGWQDKIVSDAAFIVALPPGEAHGGQQVARLIRGGSLKQLLVDHTGAPVLFEPGLKIRVSGWVRTDDPLPPKMDALHVGLHHALDRDHLYVVAYQLVTLDGPGWRHFSQELVVSNQENYLPSYSSSSAPTASVRGRPVLLTIDNVTNFGTRSLNLMLDDVEVEMIPPPKR